MIGLNRLRKNSESHHKPLRPGRVPHVRPSVHGPKMTGEALQCFLSMNHTVTDGVKAFEKCHFPAMYAGANMGHPEVNPLAETRVKMEN